MPALEWNPVATLYFLGGLLGATAAFVVYLAPPRRWPNRVLATAFFLEAAALVSVGLLYSAVDEGEAFAFQVVTNVTFLPAMFVYLLFLSTLDTPLVRPLTWPWVRGTLVIAIAALVIAAVLRPTILILGMFDPAYARWEADMDPRYFLATLLISLFALVASLHAFGRAPRGSMQRRRAAAFAAAFAARDGMVLIFSLVFTTVPLSHPLVRYVTVLSPLGYVLFALLLGYGVLRHHLFDIELRLKWTLSKGTVAAFIVAVSFFVSELAAAVLPNRFGLVAGLAAAALLVFAIAPLQRMADRFADVAMPRVQPTPAYVAFRKLEVYQAAVESAWTDATLTRRERAILDAMRRKLEIDPADAALVEERVAGMRAA